MICQANFEKRLAKSNKSVYNIVTVLRGELAVPYTCNPLYAGRNTTLGLSYGRQLSLSGVDVKVLCNVTL